MGFVKWRMPDTSLEQSAAIARALGVCPVLAGALAARGYTTPEAAGRFLEESQPLDDPFVLADMDKACARIQQAIENEEKIAIYGDYDADGITSTAMLYLYLESSGALVTYYIPSREDEGYGMNKQAVKQLAGEDVALIITVDNGIAAHEEIEYAAGLGVDVVVTDHHQPNGKLPSAYAVVNPHRTDCPSGFKDLCGAGVVLKLLAALCDGEYDDVLDFCADLAALGTIADIVPLLGENRTIVKEGLARMAQTQNAGLSALMELAQLTEPDAVSVAYQLVPRINAAGRLGLAEDALRLLITDDYQQAQELAQKITENNLKRRELDAAMTADICRELLKKPAFSQRRAVVIAREDWHPGVAGIAAARLVERLAKPAFVLCVDGDVIRGSARGVEGFSVFNALVYCGDFLERYGGHESAGGFTMKTENLPAFCEALERYCRETHEFMPVHSIEADVACHPADVTLDTLSEVDRLQPFGCKNEPLCYAFMGLTISAVIPIGAGKHIRLVLERDGRRAEMLLFGTALQDFAYAPGDRVDVLAHCDRNIYQGRESVSIKVKDIRPSSFVQDEYFCTRELCERFWNGERLTPQQLHRITPQREDAGVVYRAIAEHRPCAKTVETLAAATSSNYGKTKNAIKALSELGLVRIYINNDKYTLTAIQGAPKTELTRSDTMQRLLGAI